MKRVKNWVILASIVILSTLALWIGAGMRQIYQNFDGPYYLVVAKSWYSKDIIARSFSFNLPLEYYPAHFPLYPALIKTLAFIPGVNHLHAMVGVNVLATIAASIVLYEIAKKLNWKNPLLISILFLFISPRMWAVRSVGSPETLFICLTLLSLFFFQKGKYLWSGVWGALAVLTKSPGILLFAGYGLWGLVQLVRTKKIPWKIFPVILIPLALVGLFWFYGIRTGDMMAYFNSGDNIHLQLLPFKVFDSAQAWVGDWWLDGILWIYLFGGLGIYYAIKKDLVFGLFGLVFFTTILFVSHRDIGRYALPILPIVLLGFSDMLNKKEFKIIFLLMLIPLYFYTLNFINHNIVSIPDWASLL